MPIPISVPFTQKEQAKALGVIWNAANKTWVIPDGIKDLNSFAQWLPKGDRVVVQKPYLLLEGQRRCWKCKTATPIIALAGNQFFAYNQESAPRTQWEHYSRYAVFYEIQTITPLVLAYVQSNYPFYQKLFSKTLNKYYFGNSCVHCKSLQGEFFLIHEADSPFFPDHLTGKILAKQIELPLDFDYFICGAHASQTD